jgi:hypothetical protein
MENTSVLCKDEHESITSSQAMDTDYLATRYLPATRHARMPKRITKSPADPEICQTTGQGATHGVSSADIRKGNGRVRRSKRTRTSKHNTQPGKTPILFTNTTDLQTSEPGRDITHSRPRHKGWQIVGTRNTTRTTQPEQMQTHI